MANILRENCADLVAHADLYVGGVDGVHVAWQRLDGDLIDLCFVAAGAGDELALPPRAAKPQRRDGLWQTTCFEMFVTTGAGYAEYNFSPSGDWATYHFTGYRQGMAILDVPAPHIRMTQGDDALMLHAQITLPPMLAPDARAGFSAIIADVAGDKAYWALRHPPGRPDFHHDDCFAARLGAPQRP